MKISANGTKLFVETNGSGTPVILINGLGADSTLWNDVIPLLSKYHKVVTFDLRGTGRSDNINEKELSMEIWSKDLGGIMDALGLENASIVGWAMGGTIALQTCLDFPKRVRSAILLGSKAKLPESTRGSFEDNAKLAEIAGMNELIERTFHLMEQSFAPSFREKHPEKIELYKSLLKINDKEQYAAACRALLKADLNSQLEEILTPSLLMVGQYDNRTPLADAATMCMRMPQCVMKVVPECGHFYPLEQPELICKLVLRFLQAFDKEN